MIEYTEQSHFILGLEGWGEGGGGVFNGGFFGWVNGTFQGGVGYSPRRAAMVFMVGG
jgi:hypothetical protein